MGAKVGVKVGVKVRDQVRVQGQGPGQGPGRGPGQGPGSTSDVALLDPEPYKDVFYPVVTLNITLLS